MVKNKIHIYTIKGSCETMKKRHENNVSIESITLDTIHSWFSDCESVNGSLGLFFWLRNYIHKKNQLKGNTHNETEINLFENIFFRRLNDFKSTMHEIT